MCSDSDSDRGGVVRCIASLADWTQQSRKRANQRIEQGVMCIRAHQCVIHPHLVGCLLIGAVCHCADRFMPSGQLTTTTPINTPSFAAAVGAGGDGGGVQDGAVPAQPVPDYGPPQGKWWRFDAQRCQLLRPKIVINAPAGTLIEVSPCTLLPPPSLSLPSTLPPSHARPDPVVSVILVLWLV